MDFKIYDDGFIKYGKSYHVGIIDSRAARNIVKQYHYSGKVVSNSKLHLGVFSNETDELVGALQYGPCMNGNKTALKFSPELPMFELNRMVMIDEEPRNAESMALSLCNKWLKENTNLSYILSFSDGKENNCGYIYQANNWKYLGYLLSDSFYDLDGEIKHNVTVWHQYKEKHELRDTHTTDEILCVYFENISKITSKQHVYVMPIKKKVKFNFPFLDYYPKMDKEIAILKRKWIKKDGEVIKMTETFTDETIKPIY